MLSRFRRPEADLQIDIDKQELQPGDELEARVTLAPKADFQIREGIVSLICKEIYVQKISNQYGTSYHKKTEILSRMDESFSGTGVIRKGASYSSKLRLVVPPDALPTLRGVAVQRIQPGISWEVEASMDVANARDIARSQEVTVVKPPAPIVSPPRPIVAEYKHRQCVLTLSLSASDARSGDILEGSLRAEMLQEVTVQEVRCDLIRVEKFGNDAKDHPVDSVSLEREGTLAADRTLEWRFRLDVGQVGLTSLKTEKSSVRWLVKGILSRAMRTDLRIEQEISVDF